MMFLEFEFLQFSLDHRPHKKFKQLLHIDGIWGNVAYILHCAVGSNRDAFDDHLRGLQHRLVISVKPGSLGGSELGFRYFLQAYMLQRLIAIMYRLPDFLQRVG